MCNLSRNQILKVEGINITERNKLQESSHLHQVDSLPHSSHSTVVTECQSPPSTQSAPPAGLVQSYFRTSKHVHTLWWSIWGHRMRGNVLCFHSWDRVFLFSWGLGYFSCNNRVSRSQQVSEKEVCFYCIRNLFPIYQSDDVWLFLKKWLLEELKINGNKKS